VNICPVVGVSCEGSKYQTVALLATIEEDNVWEIKGAYSKSRGRRELLHLECFINYDTTRASSRCRKGKAHVF
jgi:hypothetical protein